MQPLLCAESTLGLVLIPINLVPKPHSVCRLAVGDPGSIGRDWSVNMKVCSDWLKYMMVASVSSNSDSYITC